VPSTSQEILDEAATFLPEVDDHEACKYLQEHGYTLTREWDWKKDGVDYYGAMTREEYICLVYLCEEWDYGGLA
jgi:hypothetical protein